MMIHPEIRSELERQKLANVIAEARYSRARSTAFRLWLRGLFRPLRPEPRPWRVRRSARQT
jgi:hypothetical protein